MEKNEKNALPTTCRIPAYIKKRLIDEANERGIPFSTYLTTLVVSTFENNTTLNTEVHDLKKERELLRQEITFMENSIQWYTTEGNRIFHTLLKNETILFALYEEYQEKELPKSLLHEKGFDFQHGTHTWQKDNRNIIGVLGISYSKLRNGKIKIIK